MCAPRWVLMWPGMTGRGGSGGWAVLCLLCCACCPARCRSQGVGGSLALPRRPGALTGSASTAPQHGWLGCVCCPGRCRSQGVGGSLALPRRPGALSGSATPLPSTGGWALAQAPILERPTNRPGRQLRRGLGGASSEPSRAPPSTRSATCPGAGLNCQPTRRAASNLAYLARPGLSAEPGQR